MRTDFLIVGGGLAGACAALWLAEHGAVTLLEKEHPAAGASGAAAGLINPLMGRKAKPTWHFETALDALHATFGLADAADLLRTEGLLRPARDEKQAEVFRARAETRPDHAVWHSTHRLAERYPDLDAPHGGLWVRHGGAVDLSAAVETLLRGASKCGADVRLGIGVRQWGEDANGAWVETDEDKRIEAGTVMLALGDGFRHHPDLDALGLHRIKGQTVRLRRPSGLGPIPPLSGFGYIVPDGHTLVVGSTYEHDFDDLQPNRAQSKTLRAKAARMVPTLVDAEITEARAGVRVTVPGDRMPLLGPLPGRRRVWVFTGLGSKGLLMAPLLARGLPRYLAAPQTIPEVVRVGRDPASR